MKKRMKMTRKASRKNFKKSAVRTHKKNLPRTVMRGGIRL